jgi:poly(hydroxyalkanoate) depolymerase family esterase
MHNCIPFSSADKQRPSGASALAEGSYTNFAGTLDYKLYRPASLRKLAPLVVMLHGCSQSAVDFASGTRMNDLADEFGAMILYPQQSKRANMLGCWNWYETRNQCTGHGEPAMLAGMTRQVMAEHCIDSARVYVAGLSAGGAMAIILGQAYPGLYAAVGVHSGVPSGVAHDLTSALSAMRRGPIPCGGDPAAFTLPENRSLVATIVFHGDCDRTVHPSNGDAVHAQSHHPRTPSRAKCVPTEEPICMPGGRAVTRRTQAKSNGVPGAELWVVHGAGHAWSGGSLQGSFTEADGPDASREMMRFFLQRRLCQPRKAEGNRLLKRR